MNRKKMFYGYDKRNIYMDNGASTLAFNEVVNACNDFLLNYGSLHRGSGYNSEISTELFELARKKILKYNDGNENEDCVIFTANTTDAINKFTLLYPFKEDSQVLISDIEHTSNNLPWRKHSNVIEFPTVDFEIVPEVIKEYLEKYPKIEIVAISAASNITGYLTDLKTIYNICHEYGKILFVDASQYAPHKKPSLKYADVIAYCGHKMYAPYGCGVLVGKKKYLSNEGLSLTGGGNVLYVDKEGTPIYKPVPFIHEAGTPNGIGAIAISKAHDILYGNIGSDFLESHNKLLLKEIKDKIPILNDFGYKTYFCDKSIDRTPIIIIENTRLNNKETVRLLNTPIAEFDKDVFVREGAFCAYRLIEKLKPELENEKKIINGQLNPKYSLIRLSCGLVNKPKDIDYVIQKLILINKQINKYIQPSTNIKAVGYPIIFNGNMYSK